MKHPLIALAGLSLIALTSFASPSALAQLQQQQPGNAQQERQQQERQQQQQRQQQKRNRCFANDGVDCDYFIAYFDADVSRVLFQLIALENSLALPLENELADGCRNLIPQNSKLHSCVIAWESSGPYKSGTTCYKYRAKWNVVNTLTEELVGCELRKWLR